MMMIMTSSDHSAPSNAENTATLPLHLTSTQSFPRQKRRNSFAGIVRTEYRELGDGDIKTVTDRRKSFKRQRSSSLGFRNKGKAREPSRGLGQRRKRVGAIETNSSLPELPISLDLGILLSIGKNNDEKKKDPGSVDSERDLNDRRRSMLQRKDSWVNPHTNNVFDDDCQDAVSMLNGRIPAGHLPHCSLRDSLASGCASIIGIEPSTTADPEKKKNASGDASEEIVEKPFEHPLHVSSTRPRSNSTDTYSTNAPAEGSSITHCEFNSSEYQYNNHGDDDRNDACPSPGLLDGLMKMLPRGKKASSYPVATEPLIVNTIPQHVTSFEWEENSEADIITIEDEESLLFYGRDEENTEVIEEAHNLVAVMEKSLKSIHVESPFVPTVEVIPRFRSIHQQFRNQLGSQNASGLTSFSGKSSLSQKDSHQNAASRTDGPTATSEVLSKPPRLPFYHGVALTQLSDRSSSQKPPGLTSFDTGSWSTEATTSGLQYIDPKLVRLFSLLEPSFLEALQRAACDSNNKAPLFPRHADSKKCSTRSFSVFQSCVIASCPMKYFYGNEDERDSDSESRAVEQLKELILKYQKQQTTTTPTTDGGVMKIVKDFTSSFLKQTDRYSDAVVTGIVSDSENDRINVGTDRPVAEILVINDQNYLPIDKEAEGVADARVGRPQDGQCVERSARGADIPVNNTTEDRCGKQPQEENNFPLPDNLIVNFDTKLRMSMADKKPNRRGLLFGWAKEEPPESVSTQDVTIEDSEDLSLKIVESHQQQNEVVCDDSRASTVTTREQEVVKHDLPGIEPIDELAPPDTCKDHKEATGRKKFDLSTIISDIPTKPLGSDLYFQQVEHDTGCKDDFDEDDPISNILKLKL